MAHLWEKQLIVGINLIRNMSLQQLIQSIIDRLQGTASVKTIFGDPIEAKGKTFIPVAKVGYGFGAGSGTKKGEVEEPEGGGGGGGISVKPKGVLEITDEDTRFISFDETHHMIAAIIIGLLFGFLIARKGSKSRT
jgi:uncharacterized spore protein YtfJ